MRSTVARPPACHDGRHAGNRLPRRTRLQRLPPPRRRRRRARARRPRRGGRRLPAHARRRGRRLAGRCSCRASPTRTSTRCGRARTADLRPQRPADRPPAYLAHVAWYAASRPDLDWVRAAAGRWRPSPAASRPRRSSTPSSPTAPPRWSTATTTAMWVNSRALEVAGITRDTPDPADGRVERDASGEPTGMLHEGAMGLVLAVLPTATADELHAGLLEGQRHLLSLGITGWQDAIVGAYAGMQDTGPTYLRAARSGDLVASVVGALWWERDRGLEQVAELVEKRTAYSHGRFAATSVKIMQDGVAENGTAALVEPYLDRCGHATTNTGLSFVDPVALRGIVGALDEAGFQVHVHGLGDRGVREALDALEGTEPLHRHQVAHLQLVHPADVPRFAELQVAANVQALWACYDDQMVDLTIPFLGEGRAARQYPFGDLHRAGARLVAGSDWPVSTPNPLEAIHVAVHRMAYGEPGRAGSEPFLPTRPCPSRSPSRRTPPARPGCATATTPGWSSPARSPTSSSSTATPSTPPTRSAPPGSSGCGSVERWSPRDPSPRRSPVGHGRHPHRQRADLDRPTVRAGRGARRDLVAGAGTRARRRGHARRRSGDADGGRGHGGGRSRRDARARGDRLAPPERAVAAKECGSSSASWSSRASRVPSPPPPPTDGVPRRRSRARGRDHRGRPVRGRRADQALARALPSCGRAARQRPADCVPVADSPRARVGDRSGRDQHRGPERAVLPERGDFVVWPTLAGRTVADLQALVHWGTRDDGRARIHNPPTPPRAVANLEAMAPNIATNTEVGLDGCWSSYARATACCSSPSAPTAVRRPRRSAVASTTAVASSSPPTRSARRRRTRGSGRASPSSSSPTSGTTRGCRSTARARCSTRARVRRRSTRSSLLPLHRRRALRLGGVPAGDGRPGQVAAADHADALGHRLHRRLPARGRRPAVLSGAGEGARFAPDVTMRGMRTTDREPAWKGAALVTGGFVVLLWLLEISTPPRATRSTRTASSPAARTAWSGWRSRRACTSASTTWSATPSRCWCSASYPRDRAGPRARRHRDHLGRRRARRLALRRHRQHPRRRLGADLRVEWYCT